MKPSLSFFSALISNIKPELFTASVYRDFPKTRPFCREHFVALSGDGRLGHIVSYYSYQRPLRLHTGMVFSLFPVTKKLKHS